MSFLGIDVPAARTLASQLSAWAPDADAVIAEILAAEALCDLNTGTVGRLDDIGTDGRAMAAALDRAANELEGFTISIDSPFRISAAFDAVHAFAGSDNDPELDQRVRELRRIVEAHTDNDAHAAEVLHRLLGGDRSALDELGLVPTQPIDPEAIALADRSDATYAAALAALVGHRHAAIGGSPLDQERQRAALLADVRALVEARWVEADRQRLGSIGGSPADQSMQLQAIHDARASRDLDAHATRVLALLGAGATIGEAEWLGAILDPGKTPHASAMVFSDARRLAATSPTAAFVDAASVAINAERFGLDVDRVIAVTADEGLDLPSAFELALTAHRLDMTVDQVHAYQGFVDRANFDAIDNARGGGRDGRVSLADLDHVIANVDGLFADELVAAAHAFRNSPQVMARLDTARDHVDGIVAGDGFGRDRLDDGLFSLDDLAAFEHKQTLNFVLGDHTDLIDNAAKGGEIDGHLSKGDFEAALARADEFGFSEVEVAALEAVVNGQLYDQNWLERNRDSLALAAAVVAGTIVFVSTGGVGAGLSMALVGSVAASAGTAAVTAGGVTVGINAFTDENLDDGVGANMIEAGIVGGLAAPGLAGSGAALRAASTTLGRGAVVTGVAAEGAGLVGAGAFDWYLDSPLAEVPLIGVHGDAIDLENLKSDADWIGLALAGTSLAGGLTDVVVARSGAGALDHGIQPAPRIAGVDAEIEFDAQSINPFIQTPGPYPDGISFRVDLRQHVTIGHPEANGLPQVNKNNGIAGTHNADAFEAALADPFGLVDAGGQPIPALVMNRTDFLDGNGRVVGERVHYRLPRRDSALQAMFDGAGQPIFNQTDYFKTTYDPAVISDDEMMLRLDAAAMSFVQSRSGVPSGPTLNADGVRIMVYSVGDEGGGTFITNAHVAAPDPSQTVSGR